jgi:hypothetical protein
MEGGMMFLNYSISTDYDVAVGEPGRYCVTEEHNDYLYILARFRVLSFARDYMKSLEIAHPNGIVADNPGKVFNRKACGR